MKQVKINGEVVNFSRMEENPTLTEGIDHNFLGYSSVYWDENGIRKILSKPAKFYK